MLRMRNTHKHYNQARPYKKKTEKEKKNGEMEKMENGKWPRLWPANRKLHMNYVFNEAHVNNNNNRKPKDLPQLEVSL